MSRGTLYDEVVTDVEAKRIRREKGLFNGIPFPFERSREYIDSWDRGMYYGILGGTGTGKSRLTRSILYNIVDFSAREHYPVKILYFALEDGRMQVFKKIMAHYLWTRHGIDISQKILDSKDIPIPDKYLQIIRKDAEFFRRFDDYVTIINERTSPNEIYDACNRAYDAFGKTHHIVVFIDNYANITKDAQDKDEWSAVKRLSRNMIRLDLCQKKNMTIFGILQTDMDTEKNTFRNAGKGGITAIEPNMGSIGDNKILARDMFTIFALFNPWRYELQAYPNSEGWNINVMRNRFRSLLMLKNNEGEVAPRLGLLFDGKHEIFSEMPLTTDRDALTLLYQKVAQEEDARREMFTKKSLFK